MKLVSVIIPYYKKRKYIEKTINSILRQEYQNFEIIIIYDDIELDDLPLIKKISRKDRRILILQNSKNLGAAKSRNIGIHKSKGSYLAFIDADDLWHPQKLIKQLHFMKNNNLSFSYTSYEIINYAGDIIKKKCVPGITTYKNLLTNCDIGLSTVVMKKNLITKKCKFVNLKTKEDYVLWLKLAKKKVGLYGLNIPLTRWRVVENSLSSNVKQKILDAFLVYRKYLKYNLIHSLWSVIVLSLNYVIKKYQ